VICGLDAIGLEVWLFLSGAIVLSFSAGMLVERVSQVARGG
jgi:hypothetical protein